MTDNERNQTQASHYNENGIPIFTLKDMLGSLGINSGSSSKLLPSAESLEYLFEDEYVANKPSFDSRLRYGTGIIYLSGLGFGGAWGLFEGSANSNAKTSRLKLNAILNACTRRGPFIANNVGLIALFYNFIYGGLGKLPLKTSDSWLSVLSAFSAGLVFRASSGPKPALVAASTCAAAMGALELASNWRSYLFNVQQALLFNSNSDHSPTRIQQQDQPQQL